MEKCTKLTGRGRIFREDNTIITTLRNDKIENSKHFLR